MIVPGIHTVHHNRYLCILLVKRVGEAENDSKNPRTSFQLTPHNHISGEPHLYVPGTYGITEEGGGGRWIHLTHA
jgi:hypothetical protein